jgi:hypothetical protein
MINYKVFKNLKIEPFIVEWTQNILDDNYTVFNVK